MNLISIDEFLVKLDMTGCKYVWFQGEPFWTNEKRKLYLTDFPLREFDFSPFYHYRSCPHSCVPHIIAFDIDQVKEFLKFVTNNNSIIPGIRSGAFEPFDYELCYMHKDSFKGRWRIGVSFSLTTNYIIDFIIKDLKRLGRSDLWIESNLSEIRKLSSCQ